MKTRYEFYLHYPHALCEIDRKLDKMASGGIVDEILFDKYGDQVSNNRLFYINNSGLTLQVRSEQTHSDFSMYRLIIDIYGKPDEPLKKLINKIEEMDKIDNDSQQDFKLIHEKYNDLKDFLDG
jgi:hypothetical protein